VAEWLRSGLQIRGQPRNFNALTRPALENPRPSINTLGVWLANFLASIPRLYLLGIGLTSNLPGGVWRFGR
jgi:hypothetical protein